MDWIAARGECVMRTVIAISIWMETVTVGTAGAPRLGARIWPPEMFAGEWKKLEPHRGLTARGCGKVEPAGKGRNFHVRLELWENGKRSDKPLGGPGLSLTSGSPFELSISVREDPGRFEKP